MQAGPHSCAKGYTVVELLIVMAIVGIVAAVGLPSFRTLIEWQRAQTRVHLLTAHLAMARSLAVMHRIPVSVCPSGDGDSCRPDRDWSRGWILFRDPMRSGQPLEAASILRLSTTRQATTSVSLERMADRLSDFFRTAAIAAPTSRSAYARVRNA